MVFTTITGSINGTRKSLAFLGRDIELIKKNWNNIGGFKNINNLFLPASYDTDIVALQAYNAEIQRGVTAQTAFNRTMDTASMTAQNFVARAEGATVNINGYRQVINKTRLTTIALKSATIALNVALSVGLMAVITLAYKGFDNLIHRSENLAEAFATIKDEINSLQDTLKEHSELIDQVVEKYDTFAKGVNLKTNANIGLSDEEYKEFIDTSNQLAEIYPELVKGYDAQGNAILDLGNNADEAKYKLNELYQTEKDFANIDILSKVDESFKAVKNDITNLMLCEVTFN